MSDKSTAFDRDAVLAFWLGADFPAAAAIEAAMPRWFVKDAALDATIAQRFGTMIEAALRGEFDDSVFTPQDRLALLILLDQFPRNVFRDTPRAFAGDTRALTLALAGIERGDDQALPPVARLFCYLPLEHSENLTLQDRCVSLFRRLRDHADPSDQQRYGEWLDYAIRHHEVIARYGRFPHRNAILGRSSTREEQAYLAEPGSGF